LQRAATGTAMATLMLAGLPLETMSPSSVLWTMPAILFAAMMIAWAAESAQFYIGQGFALAILAWLQTLPEFAVEAVLAWKQQVPLLLANLTGALRLLTGLGWPLIYFTAAYFYRRKHKRKMDAIYLEPENAAEVISLIPPLLYIGLIWFKRNLTLFDAGILILMYVGYLLLLSRMPTADEESLEEMERIPRAIVTSRPAIRNLLIFGLFGGGGAIIYFTAEPFLGSLLALSAAIGVPNFVFVQWVAPFVSEFPEKISAFYWARTVHRSPMALMNMVNSNINQWTLLTAMLVIVFSISKGVPSAIPFDDQQELELLMTLGQSVLGLLFLLNLRLQSWEAMLLFGLWFLQFALSGFTQAGGMLGQIALHIHEWVTWTYWILAAFELGRILVGKRQAVAFTEFAALWRRHVRRVA
jgi:cation:H+ antiporter